VLLGRRLGQALRAVGGRKRRPGEIVVLEGWTSREERRAFSEALAGALEAELGRAVSIVTVTAGQCPPVLAPRGDRPDAIVLGTVRETGTLRERLAAELAARTEQAPVVLVDLDEDLAGPELGLANLADAVLTHIDGHPPPHRDTGSRR